ncbi:MAG: flagellar basal-body rod protein FlgB [Bradymonadia bacterium]|jgi:flagellar basal-body rod protein FlgB
MMQGIFDGTSSLLQRTLDVSLSRQAVLTSNIANLDTPGFTPSDVRFDDAMERALSHARMGSRSARRSIGSPTGFADAISGYERPDTRPRIDGNSVDLDMQMARFSQNAILYDAGSRTLSKRLSLMRYVISEGGM